VTRVLFKFAGEMQDRSFSRIYLSYHGRVKYMMDGNDFREIGREYTRGDPIARVADPAREVVLPGRAARVSGLVRRLNRRP